MAIQMFKKICQQLTLLGRNIRQITIAPGLWNDCVSLDQVDDVRVRSNDAKRKRRKNEKTGANGKSVVSIEVGGGDEDDEVGDDDYFEEPEPFDESASFYSMKLSRPLLKAIESAKFSHPTPIQVKIIAGSS